MSINYKIMLLAKSPALKYIYITKKQQPKRRRKSTHCIYRMKEKFGEFHALYRKLLCDPRLYQQYRRMSITTFNYFVEAIREECMHHTTNFKKPISVEERLIVTISYLATGVSFRQLAFTFRISKTAVSAIVIEICRVIWNTLNKKHMPVPDVKSFENIAAEFFNKLDFPLCVGSVDGKHIRIKSPSKSGSMFYNYKQFFSIILLAVTDAKYRFLLVDVGTYGKDSDGGVLSNSSIYENLESGTLKLPVEKKLPNSELRAPIVFVSNEAFPLRPYLMRPFPRSRLRTNTQNSYFNYRLSRARMVVECSFSIMSAKFCILLKAIERKVENAVHIVKAITMLHNVIIDIGGYKDVSYNDKHTTFQK